MAVSEEQLKEIITSLLNECKTKGSIGSDALCDRLEKYDADPSQIDEIYRSLEENKIKIIDDYEKDKELYEQIIKEISMDDPVKMYLKDIKDYTDMVRHREEIMFTAEKSRTPELEQEFSTLNEKIASYRKKLFPEREAATICQEAEDGHRYHTDY